MALSTCGGRAGYSSFFRVAVKIYDFLPLDTSLRRNLAFPDNYLERLSYLEPLAG